MLVNITSAEPTERRVAFFVDGTLVARYAVLSEDKRTVTAATAQVSQTEDQDLIFADIDLTGAPE